MGLLKAAPCTRRICPGSPSINNGTLFCSQLLEQSEWQPTDVDGKGFLLNEPGIQPVSDISCKEETEVDSPGGEDP